MVFELNWNGAAGFGNGAAYVLGLDGGVRDMEAAQEYGIQAAQNYVAGGEGDVFDQHVAA